MAAETYGLTPTQRDALLVIQELIGVDGVSPTYDEIRRELDLKSKSGVHRVISSLCERGYLRRLPRQERSLAVLRPIPFPEEPAFVGFFAPGAV